MLRSRLVYPSSLWPSVSATSHLSARLMLTTPKTTSCRVTDTTSLRTLDAPPTSGTQFLLIRSSSCGLCFLDASRLSTQVSEEHLVGTCRPIDASHFAALTLRTFYIHRVRFNQIVSSSSSLTVSRYLRLIALCCVEMALVTPLTAFSIYINTAGLHIQPWVSWANTHYNFSFVELFPAFVWQAKLVSHVAIEMGRWVYPCSSIMFFMLFGFADEARRFYSAAFWRVAKVFGITPKLNGGGKASQYVSITNKLHAWLTCGMSRYKGAFRMPNSSSGDVLPPYTPGRQTAFTKKKRADSFASSLDNYDLEKEARSPTTHAIPPLDSPSHSDFGGSSTDVELSPRPYDSLHDDDDAQSVPRISISDEHPASTPPTPDGLPRPLPAAVVPSYHRPFSPPLVWPGSSHIVPPPRKASSGSISIIVHTETKTF